MKKSIFYYIAIMMIATFGSTNTLSAETSTGEIKRIYPSKAGYVFFRLKNDACITGSQYYYFEMNEEGPMGKYASKNWYSMLLASAMAGKEISVSVSSCPSTGNVEINYIYQEY